GAGRVHEAGPDAGPPRHRARPRGGRPPRAGLPARRGPAQGEPRRRRGPRPPRDDEQGGRADRRPREEHRRDGRLPHRGGGRAPPPPPAAPRGRGVTRDGAFPPPDDIRWNVYRTPASSRPVGAPGEGGVSVGTASTAGAEESGACGIMAPALEPRP